MKELTVRYGDRFLDSQNLWKVIVDTGLTLLYNKQL